MELNLLSFLILAFASYRITRFFLFDSLIAHSRDKYYVRLSNASLKGWRIKKFIAHKLLELSSCSWCLGVWISGAVYWSFTHYGLMWYHILAAIAGVQGMIHALEPGDE